MYGKNIPRVRTRAVAGGEDSEIEQPKDLVNTSGQEKKNYRNNFMNSSKNPNHKLSPLSPDGIKTKTQSQTERMLKTVNENYNNSENND